MKNNQSWEDVVWTIPYNKKLCIICQIENKNILHCAQTCVQMGDKMFSLFRCPSAISVANDAPANDVMYHNTCWVNGKREAYKTYETLSEKDFINALSDVKIVPFVEKEMADPSEKVLDMNIINKICRQIISSNGKNEALINHNCKKHLQEIYFTRHLLRNN